MKKIEKMLLTWNGYMVKSCQCEICMFCASAAHACLVFRDI